MENIKKNILFISLLIILLLVGCQYKEMEGSYEEVDAKQTDENSLEILKRSEDISDLVVDLIGIENATSIVFQDAVLIGVKIYDENEDGLTDDLKESIENVVLENDEDIGKILISEDQKDFDEIEDIIQALLNGEDIKDHASRLNKIFKKMNTN